MTNTTKQSNIVTIKTHSTKKPASKYKAYLDLISLVESLDIDNLNYNQQCLLCGLSRYFEVEPKQKATKDAFAWLAQAASNDTTRLVLNSVYVDKENIVAADGRRLHIMPAGDKKEGYYDIQGHKVEDQGNYPNYNRVIPQGYKADYMKLELSQSDLRTDEVIGVTDCLVMGDEPFNLKFVKEALAYDKTATVYYMNQGGPVIFEMKEGRKVVIMPIRRI